MNDDIQITDIDSLYDAFLKEIKEKKGIIKIQIGDVITISKANDIVGKCVEEWLDTWFHEKAQNNGFELIPNKSSQKFPDYEAVFHNKKHPMDIKCFNYNNNPAFDISNFDSFLRSTYESPDKLFADYFIFSYLPNSSNEPYSFIIKEVYKKKIWEIVGTDLNQTRKHPITIQVKQNRPYAIRPAGSFVKNKNLPNEDLLNFVNKIIETGLKFNRFGKESIPSVDKWKSRIKEYLNLLAI